MGDQSASTETTYRNASLTLRTEKAAPSALSEDALKHFKTYKYSSVDKSPVSNYILKHYVRFEMLNIEYILVFTADFMLVERLRRVSPTMAGP